MALVLPSTVEEINLLQTSNQGFENIIVEKKYKREISFPNDVQNFNISNFDPYLNFEDINDSSLNDRVVPEDRYYERSRCESISSVSSSTMDDKRFVFNSYGGVKTFNTVRMDSGSTCSDHSYVASNTTAVYNGLDPEETYQNLDLFLQQVPDISITNTDTLSSTLSVASSPMSTHDSAFELMDLNCGGSITLDMNCSQDSFTEKKNRPAKRPAKHAINDDVLVLKHTRTDFEESGTGVRYHEIRRKNNLASKNCRKTRKEKQKEMEGRVSELEKEREGLTVEVQMLEKMIQAHKTRLYAILQNR